MYQRPSVSVARAFATLKGSPAWETVVQYLSDERARCLELLAESPAGEPSSRLQGRVQVLKEVVEMAGNAQDLLTKLEAQKRRSDHP